MSSIASILGLLWLLLPTVAFAQNYTAEKALDHGVPIARLSDAASGGVVSIAPPVGNRAYEMKEHGQNILSFSTDDPADFQKNPRLNGLAPRADLLDEQAFWASRKRYVRGVRPEHGFLANSPLWDVTEVVADSQSAHLTSRLKFWKYPDLMAQWPFAQEYEMAYSAGRPPPGEGLPGN